MPDARCAAIRPPLPLQAACPEVANLVAREGSATLAAFVSARCLERKDPDRALVEDHLPLLLDGIVLALRGVDGQAWKRCVQSFSRAHADVREADPTYSLEETLAELQAFRNFVTSRITTEALLSDQVQTSTRIIQTVVDSAIETVSGDYVRVLTSRLMASQKSAHEAAHLLSSVLEQLPAGVLLVRSPSGELVLKNKASERIVGHAFDGMPDVASYANYGGQHADGRAYEPDEYPLARATLTGETIDGENVLYRKGDGTLVNLLVSAAPIKDPDGVQTHACVVFHDISEQKRIEASLTSSVASLADEMRVRERFIATLTHDLRTPLSAIRMSADLTLMLAARSGKENEFLGEATDAARRIVRNVDLADRLIRDLLDANLVRAGKSLPLRLSVFDAVELVQTTLADLSVGLKIRTTFQGPARLLGRWDRDGVRRILENLVTNAFKYGELGSPVSVSMATDEGALTLAVHNVGKPIPPAFHQMIFEPFQRTHEAHQGSQPGWGIGLSLVRAVVSAHDGRIEVESSEGAGTTFRVVLPGVQATEQKAGAGSGT